MTSLTIHTLLMYNYYLNIGDIEKSLSYLTLQWLAKRGIYLKSMRFDGVIHPWNYNHQHHYHHHYFHRYHHPYKHFSDGIINNIKEKLGLLNMTTPVTTKNMNNKADNNNMTMTTMMKGGCNPFEYVRTIQFGSTGLRNFIITDDDILSISSYCHRLQSLYISGCSKVSDTSIISLSTHCTTLQSLRINECSIISDDSIKSIACNNNNQLHIINLSRCRLITDSGLCSIAQNCTTNLTTLILSMCDNISDTSILIISKYCNQLLLFHLSRCHHITDIGITAISKNCKKLKSIFFSVCINITDVGIIAIAMNCLSLQLMHISYCCHITDNSIISITNYCTSLQELHLYGNENINVAAVNNISLKHYKRMQLFCK